MRFFHSLVPLAAYLAARASPVAAQSSNIVSGLPVTVFNSTCDGSGCTEGAFVTDGVFEPEGQEWLLNSLYWTVTSAAADPFFEIDLGEFYNIESFHLQADCDDDYDISYRTSYGTVEQLGHTILGDNATCEGVVDNGVINLPLAVIADRIFITCSAGDAQCSVSELQIFGVEAPYVPFNDYLSWDAAQAACTAIGRDLVRIDSQQAGIDVAAVVTADDVLTPYRYWIGLTDKVVEGEFRWIDDGSIAQFLYWQGDEPNNDNGNEHCVHVYHEDNNTWNDLDCNIELAYVCGAFHVGTPAPTRPPTPYPTRAPTPYPTANPSPSPTLSPCPYDGTDGNLEVNFPPLLDESNTHLTFNDADTDMHVRILVPRQYSTAAFEFEGATSAAGSYHSEDTAEGANTYWSVDAQSDLCNLVYSAEIPWEDFRTTMGGVTESRFTRDVIYATQINIEVTKELLVRPETLLLLEESERAEILELHSSDGVELEQAISYTRTVALVIPFEVRFDLELYMSAQASVSSSSLRIAEALIETSVLSVDPDATPVADALLEFVTIIPMPLVLYEAFIEVDTVGLQNNLTVSELTDKSDCADVDQEFCTQFWQVDIHPEQCTINGQYIATMYSRCHAEATNCQSPTEATDTIVMDVVSDDYCGITQEVQVTGLLSLQTAACNQELEGNIQVTIPDGGQIASTDIVELRASPTLAGSDTLTVFDESTSILGYTTYVDVSIPEEVDFSFLWDGAFLRCDVIAAIEVVVRVEYASTSGSSTVLLGISESGTRLLQDTNEIVMDSHVTILPAQQVDDDAVDSEDDEASAASLRVLPGALVAAYLAVAALRA